jgi:hypothetical protein
MRRRGATRPGRRAGVGPCPREYAPHGRSGRGQGPEHSPQPASVNVFRKGDRVIGSQPESAATAFRLVEPSVLPCLCANGQAPLVSTLGDAQTCS